MNRRAAFTLIELPSGTLRVVRKRKSHAFTLIELLIVMAILGVLVTMLVPVIAGQIEEARRKSCQANLHAIGRKMVEYAHDHKGRFPHYWSTNANWPWHAIGHKNNVPGDTDVADGTRPLFMLMYEPYEESPGVWISKATDYVPPDVFVCPSVGGAEPDPLGYSDQVGFTSYKNLSYSFQHHHSADATGIHLSILTPGSRVIMADKNPLTAFTTSGVTGGTTFYRMEATGEAHDSMSVNHGGDGQNVLRVGGSVEWATTVNLGPLGDTIWDPSNKTAGDLGRYDAPQSDSDVFLIQ